ncbi:MAG TPA: molybdopterin molybdenumtransferase MoeA, partial [Stellaceae bacterium]|nr:molybdopterin molybdenumtransferase MoeA [Stellaceae bacterium]
MIPVEEARARLLAPLHPLGPEQVGLSEAFGRVLAQDLPSRRTQPPVAVSAMDGYAVKLGGERLHVIGTAPAGHGFKGKVGLGEAVRIFTGAPVPEGADAVI